MNTDERILQILDHSACLSKNQLLGYLKHTLYPEELRAVELHLSSCALCNDALEGLELQQDAEELLASMTLPALPALPPREKPKEKKDIPAAPAREEKAAAAAPAAKNAQPSAEPGGSHTLRPQRSLARPVGIAAALALIFGALWYFGFRKEHSEPQLAEKVPVIADSAGPAAGNSDPDTSHRPDMAAAEEAEAKAAAEKKHKDSLLLARKAEASLKARLDSTQAIAAQTEPRPLAPAPETASAPAEEDAAKTVAARKMAATAPARDDKEEPKKELSDFELGMQKFREKNYASALLYFRSAESDKDDPKHWEAVYYSGLCNRYLNKDRRARKLFERIVDAGAPQKKAAQKQLDDMKKKKDGE